MDATDAMTSQTIEARKAYRASDIILAPSDQNNLVHRLSDGRLLVDYSCFVERSRGATTVEEGMAQLVPDGGGSTPFGLTPRSGGGAGARTGSDEAAPTPLGQFASTGKEDGGDGGGGQGGSDAGSDHAEPNGARGADAQLSPDQSASVRRSGTASPGPAGRMSFSGDWAGGLHGPSPPSDEELPRFRPSVQLRRSRGALHCGFGGMGPIFGGPSV